MLCVSCTTNEAAFDEYLCGECAASFDITKSNARFSYNQIFNITRGYISTLGQYETDGKPKGVYVAPAINFHNARRLHYFIRLCRLVEGIEGNFVECGVEHGRSLLYLASIVYDGDRPRHIWGFDSFDGPKQVVKEDVTDKTLYGKQEPNRDYTIKQLIGLLASYGIPAIWINSNVTIVQGFFEESLDMYDGKPVAFLHLDCNYYASYRTCLEYFYPLMPNSGIIALDEYAMSWDLLHFPGAKTAIDEFCLKTGEKVTRDPRYGKCYIVVSRKDDINK